MKIGTWSIVVGNNACNARCPYCVAKMTSKEKLRKKINWSNFDVARKLAHIKGVTTVLLTGKGEPTLHPDQIMEYLKHLKQDFPFVELQTNGIELANPEFDQWLNLWKLAGLTTICISMAHYDSARNSEILGTGYDIGKLIDKLHDIGYSVRLNLIGVKGWIDNVNELTEFLQFARDHGVEQTTYRKVSMPDKTENSLEVWEWTKQHLVEDGGDIYNYINSHATKIMTLPHGAEVFDYHGQNICLADCLSIKPETDDLRQIIFFPDGAIRYDWRYKGARLL